jgi:hypothetical protein
MGVRLRDRPAFPSQLGGEFSATRICANSAHKFMEIRCECFMGLTPDGGALVDGWRQDWRQPLVWHLQNLKKEALER